MRFPKDFWNAIRSGLMAALLESTLFMKLQGKNVGEAYTICLTYASHMELTDPKSVWPTTLNICQYPDKNHYKKANYCVRGYVTMICSQCLWHYESEDDAIQERSNILNKKFKPDIHGTRCPQETDD